MFRLGQPGGRTHQLCLISKAENGSKKQSYYLLRFMPVLHFHHEMKKESSFVFLGAHKSFGTGKSGVPARWEQPPRCARAPGCWWTAAGELCVSPTNRNPKPQGGKLRDAQKSLCFSFPGISKILYNNSLVLVTERLEEATESCIDLFSFPPK